MSKLQIHLPVSYHTLLPGCQWQLLHQDKSIYRRDILFGILQTHWWLIGRSDYLLPLESVPSYLREGNHRCEFPSHHSNTESESCCRLIQNKSTRNMKSMESAIYQGLVSIVDLQWPAKRWPIHVFTFGAMFCLTTSTICHLFGSLGYKKIAHVRPPPCYYLACRGQLGKLNFKSFVVTRTCGFCTGRFNAPYLPLHARNFVHKRSK